MKLTTYAEPDVTLKLLLGVCAFSEIENGPSRAPELALAIVIETDVGSPLLYPQVIWLETNTEYFSDPGSIAETIEGAVRRPRTARATDFGEKNIVVGCVLLGGKRE